jgi:hypothetical protein
MELPLPGPDGFLIAPGDPLREEHHRIDEYLLQEEQQGTRGTAETRPWKKLAKGGMASQIEAVLRRLRWLDLHDSELDKAHEPRTRLRPLLRGLYKIKVTYTEPQIRTLLDLTVPLLGRIEPYGPVELVGDHLKSNDLTPELCGSLRTFQQSLREEMSINQASMTSLRQQLHMLLWLDEWDPLDPARCWSECVRRDFREFSGERRMKWRALFKHFKGNAPVNMPPAWGREAAVRISAVGLEDFREQVQVWFAPFRSGEPLPLSVAGSHVLKGFTWYSAVSQDEELKETCLWLLESKWRQKRNTEKVMTALKQFGVTEAELNDRGLLRPPRPDPLPRLIERLRAACCQPMGQIVADPESDLIVVQGQLHFYRLTPSTLTIERVSDGQELVLKWRSLPDDMRWMLKEQCDSLEQLHLRSRLLKFDSLFGRYFEPKPTNSDS